MKTIEIYRTAIEEFLKQAWQGKEGVIFDAMYYSLLAGGKRIRPVLTLAFCEMTGGNWRDALPLACALEMVHTYSLIHDDLPCMDDDDLRRGLPTNHKIYGEAMAVLAGDGLLTHAFATALTAPLAPNLVIGATRELANCAGPLGMVAGQVLDMEGEKRPLDGGYIHDTQRLKTGKLLEAGCVMGTIAGGGSDYQIMAARQYGASLGLAFQTQDDILDVTATKAAVGKSVGTDGNKNTFVRLYGLDACRTLVQEETQKAIEALSVFEHTEFLVSLAENLANRGK